MPTSASHSLIKKRRISVAGVVISNLNYVSWGSDQQQNLINNVMAIRIKSEPKIKFILAIGSSFLFAAVYPLWIKNIPAGKDTQPKINSSSIIYNLPFKEHPIFLL